MLKPEDIKNVLDALIEGFKKENREKEQKLIQYFLQNRDELIKDLGYIHLFVIFRLKNILSEALNEEVADILVHYNFFQHHIRYFINAVEGSCCEADKTRHILRRYIRSRLENRPFRITKGNDFWMTGLWVEEHSHKWEEYIEALRHLLHGRPELYLDFINSSSVASTLVEIQKKEKQFYALSENSEEKIKIAEEINSLVEKIKNSPEYYRIGKID